MIDCAIIGGGSHARAIMDVMERIGKFNVIGYVDRADQNLRGIAYLGPDDEFQRHGDASKILCVNGIGGANNTRKREQIFGSYVGKGFRFISIIHPSSVISPRTCIKDGSLIMAGVIINAGSVICENSLINTSTSIDHDSKIGAHTHIAPGCTLCGGVHIGEGSFIGAGTTIIQNVRIGSGCRIGAGCVVVRDVPDGENINCLCSAS